MMFLFAIDILHIGKTNELHESTNKQNKLAQWLLYQNFLIQTNNVVDGPKFT